MLNIARGAQAYQQAQTLNPLAVEKAKADLSLSQTQAQKAQRTLEYDIAHAKATANNAIAQANDAQLANIQKQQANSSRNLIKLLDSQDPITPSVIKDHVVETMSNAGAPDQAIVQAVQGLPKSGTDKELRAYLAKHTLNSLTAEAELEKRFPSSQMLNTGQEAVPITMGNPSLAMQAPGTAVGNGIQLQLPPSTPTISPSGQPGYLGAQKNQGFTPSALPPGVETQMKAPAESYAEYVKAIPKKQYSANMVNISSEELKEALSKFKPGAGTSTMVGLSQKLQAIGAPQSLVDKIAGGDLSAAQETQKFLARSVMDNLKVAAQGDPTRVAEIDNFVKNFPQFDTDPRAINKFIEFSQKQANRDLQEINFYNKKQEKGEINPNTYFGELQNYMQNQGFVPKIGEAKATIAGSKKETQVGHGKVVKTGSYNGKPVVQYEDGFVEYK